MTSCLSESTGAWRGSSRIACTVPSVKRLRSSVQMYTCIHLLSTQRLVAQIVRTRDGSLPNMWLNRFHSAVFAVWVAHAAPIVAWNLSEGLGPQASCYWIALRTRFVARLLSRQIGQYILVCTHSLQPECGTVIF